MGDRARPARRAAVTVATFAFVLAAGVLAVGAFLDARPAAASLRCTATLPDGSAHILSSEQANNAALIAAIAGTRELPARAVTIALATALQESKLVNIDHGDRDSLGLFQQRPSQGWGTAAEVMDPVHSTNAFFDALVTIQAYEDMAITVAAQAVQRSAYPEAYGQHETRSRAFASALTGHSQAALACDLEALESPTADLAGTVTARVTRDWGGAPVTAVTDSAGRDHLVVAAPGLLPAVDAVTAAWSVGQWAVASAEATGVSTVVVGDRIWQRGVDGWHTAPTELVQAAGSVLLG